MMKVSGRHSDIGGSELCQKIRQFMSKDSVYTVKMMKDIVHKNSECSKYLARANITSGF